MSWWHLPVIGILLGHERRGNGLKEIYCPSEITWPLSFFLLFFCSLLYICCSLQNKLTFFFSFFLYDSSLQIFTVSHLVPVPLPHCQNQSGATLNGGQRLRWCWGWWKRHHRTTTTADTTTRLCRQQGIHHPSRTGFRGRQRGGFPTGPETGFPEEWVSFKTESATAIQTASVWAGRHGWQGWCHLGDIWVSRLRE